MQKHKFNIFPEMSNEEYEQLKSDIKANGFDKSQPIITFEGEIIDGWNRYQACCDLDVEPITKQFNGNSIDAINFIMRTNKRRNLTSSQWAGIAIKATTIIDAIKDEAKKKQIEAAKTTHSNQYTKVQVRQFVAEPAKSESNTTETPKLEKLIITEEQKSELKQKAEEKAFKEKKAKANKKNETNFTATKVSTLFNTNKQYIKDATSLQKEDPEIIEQLIAGTTTITKAKRTQKEKKREARREENREKVSAVAEPTKIIEAGAKFATIVIDPPWDWGDEGDNDQLGRAKPDYSTMSIEQLLKLPVADLADDDCHIYLWITNRSLPKGFKLLESWGFRYITAITWVKPSFGMGNYFRGQTEHVLFGVKGSQMLKRKDVSTVFNAPRGNNGHSSKPEEFFSLVESCSPSPYIEMFSRTNRKDWMSWGENA